MNSYQLIIFLAFICFKQTICKSQTIENEQHKIELINKEVEALMLKENIPAISLAIVVNGNEKKFLNYGHKDRSKKQKIDENSIYQIASLSKMFIGIITQHLILEGKIKANQPVTHFLNHPLKKKTFKKLNKITIEALLHHTAGVPPNGKSAYKRRDGEPYVYNYTLTDLKKNLKKMKIKSAGEHKYSNFGYALLAFILEKASNSTYDELLQKYIIEPYGLESTALSLPTNKNEQVVTPYKKDKRLEEMQLWEMGKLGPPSAIYSSTDDLTKIMIAQIEAYRLYNNKNNNALVLTENIIPIYGDSGIHYGYGMVKWTNETFGHGGDMDGFESDYSITPNKNYGIVILTSSGGNWVPRFIRKINKILTE